MRELTHGLQGPPGTWPPGLRGSSVGLPGAGALAGNALCCGALALSIPSGAAHRHMRSGVPFVAHACLESINSV